MQWFPDYACFVIMKDILNSQLHCNGGSVLATFFRHYVILIFIVSQSWLWADLGLPRVHVCVCVCVCVWVYSGYIIHHYNGIWGTCAPGRRTMVHKGDYVFWKIQGTLMTSRLSPYVCLSVNLIKIHISESIIARSLKLLCLLLTTLWDKFILANGQSIIAFTGRAHCQRQVAFFMKFRERKRFEVLFGTSTSCPLFYLIHLY